ncbi:hypothetical protein lhe_0079 [Lactobacillus helveticus CNRZ32]|nr:hypothetical protein lhe_0079 [Lactobacillus helveticus CNRZ32]AHI11093.1 hypothetical protein LBH_0055 [Lactobacillus helveticus H9]EEW68521.1 hypothetical protein HMPREF0518_0521 [Lactobacillus helveticus DSM 20075 = CGMCC 1.1877]
MLACTVFVLEEIIEGVVAENKVIAAIPVSNCLKILKASLKSV